MFLYDLTLNAVLMVIDNGGRLL